MHEAWQLTYRSVSFLLTEGEEVTSAEGWSRPVGEVLTWKRKKKREKKNKRKQNNRMARLFMRMECLDSYMHFQKEK